MSTLNSPDSTQSLPGPFEQILEDSFVRLDIPHGPEARKYDKLIERRVELLGIAQGQELSEDEMEELKAIGNEITVIEQRHGVATVFYYSDDYDNALDAFDFYGPDAFRDLNNYDYHLGEY